MKVKEIIAEFGKMPQDAEVLVDLQDGGLSEVTRVVHALSDGELKDIIGDECVIIQGAKGEQL